MLTQTASRDRQATAADPKAKLCRSMIVTGPRLPKRVCQKLLAWGGDEGASVKSIVSRRTLVRCEMREIFTTACLTRSEGLAA